ncbi:conjugal transfer protein TraN [Sulfurimonas sp.]|uniref:conjugal transfer protein TraN n=1 Tax=Sulfurimonas sp. TaxID=2022749 RepID=UPI00263583FC|nr:conjugal transfer protein TraN [Sulfurimonas sp.]MDD3450916.1 conjugal transfer protein TraN [Sulfurimonas sp.]
MKINLLFIQAIFFSSLFALDCSSTKDILEYNGHYYTVTTDKLTFDVAKQVAENNGGYLAIPNTTTENNFIKGLIGGSAAWIGVWDPNYSSSYCYEGSGVCSTNPSRFKTVKNEALTYSNWDAAQPDNFVRDYDIVDNMAMVAPLGEHWGIISGNNGKWADYGSHADSFNNPAMFIAVFEYDTKPECFKEDDAISADDFTAKKCNTSVWDETADVLTPGQTFNCMADQYGTNYCPEALAPADTYWDYNDGYSVANTGTVVDYVGKVATVTQNPLTFKLQQTSSSNSNWTDVSSSGSISARPAMANGYIKFRFYDNKLQQTSSSNSNWTDVSSSGSLSVQPAMANGYLKFRFYDNKLQQTSSSNSNWTDVSSSGSISVQPAMANGYLKFRLVSEGGGTTTTYTCPPTYTDNGTNCKKTISYTYYNYLCSTGTVIDDGGNCLKTDPNLTLDNTSTLDDPCNSSTPPPDNCKAVAYTCNSTLREPAWVDNQWQCSPFPCIGESDVENLDASVGASDPDNGGWNENGGCDGQIYLFSGKGEKCRSWDMFFGLVGGGCCDKDKVFAGLIACKANEKLLAEKNKAEQCHYVGEFCSKKIKLGFVKICVQKSKGHCCFNSKLGRILQEQGRAQLNIGWGSGENPQCRGFTPEEFQKLDFSKMDLSEVFEDIKLNTINMTTITDNIKNKVKDINR